MTLDDHVHTFAPALLYGLELRRPGKRREAAPEQLGSKGIGIEGSSLAPPVVRIPLHSVQDWDQAVPESSDRPCCADDRCTQASEKPGQEPTICIAQQSRYRPVASQGSTIERSQRVHSV